MIIIKITFFYADINHARKAGAITGRESSAVKCHIVNHITVRERQIRTAVDFQRDQPAVYLWAGFSLRLGQAVSLAVRILVQCLGVLARHRQSQKEAV